MAAYAFQWPLSSLFGVQLVMGAGRVQQLARVGCVTQLKALGNNASQLPAGCLATPTDCFVTFVIFSLVFAGGYTLALEARALKLIHKFAAWVHGVWMRCYGWCSSKIKRT